MQHNNKKSTLYNININLTITLKNSPLNIHYEPTQVENSLFFGALGISTITDYFY